MHGIYFLVLNFQFSIKTELWTMNQIKERKRLFVLQRLRTTGKQLNTYDWLADIPGNTEEPGNG